MLALFLPALLHARMIQAVIASKLMIHQSPARTQLLTSESNQFSSCAKHARVVHDKDSDKFIMRSPG